MTMTATAIHIDELLNIIDKNPLVLNRVQTLLKRKQREEEEIKNTFPYRKRGHWLTQFENRLIKQAYERAKESHEQKIRDTGIDRYEWVYTAYKDAWEERQRLLEQYADRV
jgi:hypothetical protein